MSQPDIRMDASDGSLQLYANGEFCRIHGTPICCTDRVTHGSGGSIRENLRICQTGCTQSWPMHWNQMVSISCILTRAKPSNPSAKTRIRYWFPARPAERLCRFCCPYWTHYLQPMLHSELPCFIQQRLCLATRKGTLGRLLEAAGAEPRLGTFDGDTPREERTRIQSQADFMITNPDMLHSGILPNHNRRWRTFLSRLPLRCCRRSSYVSRCFRDPT